jgi:homoserine/homoserine lactone efflux protein
MDWDRYFAFVATTILLIVVPGPNVALIVANSVAHGTRAGLVTVAGTSLAMVPQLGLTLFGMSAALTVVLHWFTWLRWVGVFYLAYLGVKQWLAKPLDLLAVQPERRSAQALFARGFLVSLTNPKTLLFYAAFFPQFVDVRADVRAEFAILAATFLVLAVVLDSSWAVLAGRARPLLASRSTSRTRLSGTLLLGAAIGLALARKQ